MEVEVGAVVGAEGFVLWGGGMFVAHGAGVGGLGFGHVDLVGVYFDVGHNISFRFRWCG